jgi:hypothetical protein
MHAQRATSNDGTTAVSCPYMAKSITTVGKLQCWVGRPWNQEVGGSILPFLAKLPS